MKTIEHNGELIAIIIPADYHAEGIEFFTPTDFSQQLAYMNHSAGHKIEPHEHNFVSRSVNFTKEVLIIRKGKLRADFYDKERKYIVSCILKSGDVILLASGGHGFEVLEDLEMIEVKQGPYAGDKDKTRFDGIATEKIIIKRDL